MRHPTQAALRPPAQAEALYDIALERESNRDDPDEFVYPAERTKNAASTQVQNISTIGQPAEGAMPDQVRRTVLSENPALPPNVHQTSH